MASLALLMTGLLCFLFFCYLALKGRLPYRAVTVALLPAAAMVFCLLGECPLPTARKGWRAALGILLAVGMAAPLPALLGAVRRRRSPWDYNAHADMDAQALAHPDLLLVYSTELVNDMRMFPDTSQGVPQNLTFWGGWSRGSRNTSAKLAAFGVDGEYHHRRSACPALRFISLKEAPDEAPLAYLRLRAGAGGMGGGEGFRRAVFLPLFPAPDGLKNRLYQASSIFIRKRLVFHEKLFQDFKILPWVVTFWSHWAL